MMRLTVLLSLCAGLAGAKGYQVDVGAGADAGSIHAALQSSGHDVKAVTVKDGRAMIEINGSPSVTTVRSKAQGAAKRQPVNLAERGAAARILAAKLKAGTISEAERGELLMLLCALVLGE